MSFFLSRYTCVSAFKKWKRISLYSLVWDSSVNVFWEQCQIKVDIIITSSICLIMSKHPYSGFIHGRFSIQSGTIHAEARNRGRFHSAGPNPPRKRPASWKVHPPERNHPRWGLKSWKVPFLRVEPSTKMPRIMEGSMSRTEPSALRHDIMYGWLMLKTQYHAIALITNTAPS